MRVREANLLDSEEWSRMRSELWPDSIDDNPSEIRAFFDGKSIDIVTTFVLERERKGLAGFIELNIRNFAEGSRNRRVPYVEGWFVDLDKRGEGWGRVLIETAEKWAKAQGFSELASDAELTNHNSIQAHKHLGFEETERVVCFLKSL